MQDSVIHVLQKHPGGNKVEGSSIQQSQVHWGLWGKLITKKKIICTFYPGNDTLDTSYSYGNLQNKR